MAESTYQKNLPELATIALGYADGYPRPYSAQAKVIVNGVVCPIAGNICMDQCMIDVSNVPNVKVGDEVIVMGSDGVNTILADDIARSHRDHQLRNLLRFRTETAESLCKVKVSKTKCPAGTSPARAFFVILCHYILLVFIPT